MPKKKTERQELHELWYSKTCEYHAVIKEMRDKNLSLEAIFSLQSRALRAYRDQLYHEIDELEVKLGWRDLPWVDDLKKERS
ncbi:MAG: hypothetical protein ISN29_00645 [Gammaproteobacteria bacterium AqS3]|nr:hypothetical protein [Gammaproteobacteria bacterium AqS3]